MTAPFPGAPSLVLSQVANTQPTLCNFHVLPKDLSGRNFMKFLIDQDMYLFPKICIYSQKAILLLSQSSCKCHFTELPHKSQVKLSLQSPLEESDAKGHFSSRPQTWTMMAKPKFQDAIIYLLLKATHDHSQRVPNCLPFWKIQVQLP